MAKEKISIFGKKPIAATPKKTDKTIVNVDGLEEKLLEFDFMKSQMEDLKAQLEAVTDEIKDISKEKFIELYTNKRTNPNTFLIKDGEGCVMVIPQDRYTKIKEEERAEYLKSQYGDEVITEDIKYVFNNEVLERNMKAIETLISNAKNISDYDKKNLITPIIEYSVAKGFIDKIYEYEDMGKVLDDIQPVIALKNCGGKMELGGETSSDDFIANIYEDGGATCGCSHKYEDGGEMDSDFIANIYEDGQYEYAKGGGVGSLTKTIQINTQSINEFLELLNEQGFKKPKFIKNVKEVEGKFPYPTNYAIYEVTAETPFQKELLTDFFHKYEFKNGGMFAKGGGVEIGDKGEKQKNIGLANDFFKKLKSIIANINYSRIDDNGEDILGWHKNKYVITFTYYYGIKSWSHQAHIVATDKEVYFISQYISERPTYYDSLENDRIKTYKKYISDTKTSFGSDNPQHQYKVPISEKFIVLDLLTQYDDFKMINNFAKGGGVESKISKEELESKVGRKLNGWNDGKVYEKCFLKPYYKIIN